ncbi:MAG: 5-formyltetrahydrofolate cyclo-ligase [Bacteroidales bacterium]|jgi:hypothetical protein|nr:5-formyltetrahydrofolate cyclo-ligase [Bacteroidales bacterium]
MAKKEKNEEKVDLTVFIDALSAVYSPVHDPKEVTHWFSTSEVWLAIKDINPSAQVSKECVFQALSEAGYKFQSRPCASGCEFFWMFKTKK